MILVDEKTEQPSLSPTPRSPASYYAPPSPGYHARSVSSGPSSSAGSSTLRAPPSWPLNSSETVLPLSSSPHPSFPPLSASHSETYLPVKPAEPPSLTRPVPPNLPRTPFQPMFLLADRNSLKQGFPAVLPPTSHQPHPFSWSDINETDWTRFLEEMRTVARLTQKEKNLGYSIPILSAIPWINIAIASAIMHHIQRKKPALVSLLVDKWNHHFFHPRNIEVILMRGQTKLSGQSDQAVANLYTPRTVNFKPPPLSGTNNDPGDDRHASKGDNKIYRLFVVSMES
ncbi:hypothetical protein B0H19DRAFT_1365138 [Mycena capillaripes]|nr:hypothetical protein B0H19DRAFT_1365138 [Mycena capillaripes]